MPAFIELRKRLFGGGFSDTSGKLWDALIRTTDVIDEPDEWSRAFDHARLELTHPTRTDTSTALRFLNKFYPESDLENTKERAPASAELRASLRKLLHLLRLRL